MTRPPDRLEAGPPAPLFPPPARTRLIPAMARGFLGRCPHCGKGHVFGRFLKVRPDCEACGLEMHGHRADDLPPYLVIFLVGHLVGALILEVEMGYDLPLWVSLTLWPGLTLGLAIGLLQPVKGAVVGLQYALGMHGFERLPTAAAGPNEEVRVGSGDRSTPARLGRA